MAFSDFTMEVQPGVVLSTRAGTGGQEAMLFAKELFCMYQNYASFRGWTFEIQEASGTDIGGYHFASAYVKGPCAFKSFRFVLFRVTFFLGIEPKLNLR